MLQKSPYIILLFCHDIIDTFIKHHTILLPSRSCPWSGIRIRTNVIVSQFSNIHITISYFNLYVSGAHSFWVQHVYVDLYIENIIIISWIRDLIFLLKNRFSLFQKNSNYLFQKVCTRKKFSCVQSNHAPAKKIDSFQIT